MKIMTGMSLLMDAITDVHNLHSYVLLFLCLNKKNNHVVISGQDQESDVHGLQDAYSIASICAVIWIRSLVLARDDAIWGTFLLFLDVFPTLLFIKNAVQGTANVLHDGQVDVRAEACLCTHRQMNIICILMFFCSCVF